MAGVGLAVRKASVEPGMGGGLLPARVSRGRPRADGIARRMHDSPAPPTHADWLARVAADPSNLPVEKRLVTRLLEGLAVEPVYPDAPAPGPHPPARRGFGIVAELRAESVPAARSEAEAAIQGGADHLHLVADAGLTGGPAGRGGVPVRTVEAVLGALGPVASGSAALGSLALPAAAAAAAAGVGRWWALVDPWGEQARAGAAAGNPAARAAAALEAQAGAPEGHRLLGLDGPWHDAGATDEVDLAARAASYVAWMRAAGAAGGSAAGVRAGVAAVLPLGTEVFVGIAKLRAFRQLIARLDALAGLPPGPPVPVMAGLGARALLTEDPWSNLLRGSAAAFAAAAGGADLLWTPAFDTPAGPPSALGARLARTTGLLLREECHLGRVADPARGAGLVESLTAGLAARAWAVLGEIDAQGGLAEAVASGWLAARVEAGAAARAGEIRRRKRILIGANEHLPPAGQPLPPRPPPAAPTPPPGAAPAPLHPGFAFAPLDADWLRVRAAVAGRPGVVPAVRVGPEKDTAARLAWSARLLGLVGLALPVEAAVAAPGGVAGAALPAAPVVALLATDAILATDGPALVAALRAAGAGAVLVAGAPGAQEAALRAAGAAFFIHLGADAVDVLGALHAAVTEGAAP